MSRLPNLVIAGVGKAGTTSLFWYLSQHPDICASHEKEIRYFAALTEGGSELPPLESYAAHFRHCRGERYALEASPQYFHGGARVVAAVRELDREDRGDVLVFLPGEKHIRDVDQALSKAKLHHTEVVPLYARLSTREQERVFKAHNARRVVLATNVV